MQCDKEQCDKESAPESQAWVTSGNVMHHYALPSLSWMKMVASAGSPVIRSWMLVSGSVKSTSKLIVNCSIPSMLLSSVISIVKHLSSGVTGGVSSIARSISSWKSLAVARKEYIKHGLKTGQETPQAPNTWWTLKENSSIQSNNVFNWLMASWNYRSANKCEQTARTSQSIDT